MQTNKRTAYEFSMARTIGNSASDWSPSPNTASFPIMLTHRNAIDLREIGKSVVLNLREIGKITVLNLRGNEKYLISAAEIAFGIMEKRVFKRKVYAKILQWKQDSNGETALMIHGHCFYYAQSVR